MLWLVGGSSKLVLRALLLRWQSPGRLSKICPLPTLVGVQPDVSKPRLSPPDHGSGFAFRIIVAARCGRSTLPWLLVCLSLRKVSAINIRPAHGPQPGDPLMPVASASEASDSDSPRPRAQRMGRGQVCCVPCTSPLTLAVPTCLRGGTTKRTTSQCKSEPPLLRTSKRTIYTAGRPPWYNEHGTQSKEAFAIGLGGGSASGKTTVARMIIEALDVPWVVLLSMDSFYKVLTRQQQEQAAHNNFNFDHPDAFDFDLIISTLKKLKQGKSVKVPIYDFTTHSRKKDWKTLYGANVIIFEGIMAFADKTLLELLDMKIFVDTDSDIRLVRRLRRDISERGRDIEGVIKQYNKFVKPAFDQYIQPTMRVADIVVPRGSGNTVAIDLIVQHVHSQLEEDHDVPEDKIFLLSLLMAEMGVHSVAYAFPRVRIITTAVDKRINDLFRIIPGIGNFGDRYFGTDAVPDGSDEEEGGSAG
ncbi:Uridine-cytidine kinase-like 1, partial [Eschrichtius robustus]|nr:Uridine-cytidine kinase-like 1 [Eschrichtius robustus]